MKLTFRDWAGDIIGNDDMGARTSYLILADNIRRAPYIHLPASLEFLGVSTADANANEDVNIVEEVIDSDAGGGPLQYEEEALADDARMEAKKNPGVADAENPGVEEVRNPGVEGAENPGVHQEVDDAPKPETIVKEEATPLDYGQYPVCQYTQPSSFVLNTSKPRHKYTNAFIDSGYNNSETNSFCMKPI